MQENKNQKESPKNTDPKLGQEKEEPTTKKTQTPDKTEGEAKEPKVETPQEPKTTEMPNPFEEEQEEESRKEKAIAAAAMGGSFIPKEKEKHLFHMILEKPAYVLGEKVSKPFIQKFKPKDYNQFLVGNQGLAYKTKLIWNPELYKL